MVLLLALLNKENKVQECDATMLNSYTKAGDKKIVSLSPA